MGFDGFGYRTAADIFREHAALSGFENTGKRAFDIGSLSAIGDSEFNALAPVQWPVPVSAAKTERFFGQGGFFTTDRKARLHAPERPEPQSPLSMEFPFRLNTGRVRDQWHTMTRTGLSPRLGAHFPEPFVEVHPEDAAKAKLFNGGFARLTTLHGTCILKIIFSEGQRRGSLFAPIHWSDSTASFARVGDLVAPMTDPYSGQPESKATPVRVEPVSFAFSGFALTRNRIDPPADAWWCRVAVKDGHGLLIASNDRLAVWWDMACGEKVAEYIDEPRGLYRAAHFVEGSLESCLFIGPTQTSPSWDAMKALFEADAVSEGQRRTVLSGKSSDGLADPGALVCACFGVGINTIRNAIGSGAACSVEDIGSALRAGTNCGSCLPELKRIIGDGRLAKAV